MKLEYIEDKIPVVSVIVTGLFMAVAFGLWAGSGDFKMPLMMLGAFLAITLMLLFKKEMWILIPATWMLAGKISALPIPFSIAHVAVLLAFGVFLTLKALKIVRLKPKNGIVEIWMLIMLAYLATVYVRNPVGVEALGSERVGGRPYVDIIIAFIAFWVLSRSVAGVRQVVILPFLGVAGNAFHAAVNFIAFQFPSTAGPLSQFYSSISAAEGLDSPVPVQLPEAERLFYLQGLGASLTTATSSYWRPLTVLNPLRFWRFLPFAIGVVFILISGFRSNLFGFFETFFVCSYFYRGWREVFKAAAPLAGFLLILILLQGNVVNLPFAVQRTLSFLPGKWEYAAKADAEGSTEWRVTMWKEMLSGDKYIESKWLGDGFGFTHRQLEIMQANAISGTNADQQENLMISGGVHSGPITTIRYVGYVGLALFMIFLVLIARRGYLLIRRARNTPFFPLALFFNVMALLYPLNFAFIFGAFEADFANAIYLVGLQKLLENSLDAYLGEKETPRREIIQPPKAGNVPRFAPAGAR